MDPLDFELETIEAATWRDVFEGAEPRLSRRLGLETAMTAGATMLRAPGLDHPLFNRVLGLDPGARADAVGRMVDGYRDAGVARYRNMRRHGLRPMYRRENGCPPGAAWGRAVA